MYNYNYFQDYEDTRAKKHTPLPLLPNISKTNQTR